MVERKPRLIAAVLGLAALLAAASGRAETLRATGHCHEGLPHGAYRLLADDGILRAVGAFNRGKRSSSFIFWSPVGVRVAQISYDEGLWSGTLAQWYADPSHARDPRPKVEAGYAAGKLNGETRSWYANGARRTSFLYDHGTLVDAKAWAPSGASMPGAEARTLAARDAEADERYYKSLEAIVDAHPPRCDEAASANDRTKT